MANKLGIDLRGKVILRTIAVIPGPVYKNLFICITGRGCLPEDPERAIHALSLWTGRLHTFDAIEHIDRLALPNEIASFPTQGKALHEWLQALTDRGNQT